MHNTNYFIHNIFNLGHILYQWYFVALFTNYIQYTTNDLLSKDVTY